MFSSSSESKTDAQSDLMGTVQTRSPNLIPGTTWSSEHHQEQSLTMFGFPGRKLSFRTSLPKTARR